MTSIRGGLPVSFGGLSVSGLGVAGGPQQQDAEIVAVVIRGIGTDQNGAADS